MNDDQKSNENNNNNILLFKSVIRSNEMAFANKLINCLLSIIVYAWGCSGKLEFSHDENAKQIFTK